MRNRRLITFAGLLLFACALVGASAYGLAVVRTYNPQVFSHLPANPFAKKNTPTPARKLYMSGVVFANDLKQQEAGRSVAKGIGATVACNGAQTTAGPDGSYSLLVTAAESYRCTVSVGDEYAPLKVLIPAPTTPYLDVNFGPGLPGTCAATGASAVIVCPVLQPQTGLLKGTVTNGDTHTPAAGLQVQCWNAAGGTPADVNPHKYFSATTDAQGSFTLKDVPSDRYDCTVSTDWQLHSIGVAAQITTQLNMQVCHAHCPDITYHNGPVMHTYTVYLIFWLPKGYVYDSLGTANFERIVSNYFKDLGGSAYYNIATQYWDYNGAIQNNVALGGIWNDTQPYPHAATRSDPLLDDDIQSEVDQAAAANNWTIDMDHAFFVFTGYGAEICYSSAKTSCSFGSVKTGFCGYHDYTGSSQAIYAEIVDNFTCAGSLSLAPYFGPNGDRLADDAVDVVAHEQFESATDPMITAWYDDRAHDGEVADKCEFRFGTVHLNHGHSYYIQPEWSNLTNGCAYGQ